MILSNVNIGTGPSAGDGDPLRSAFSTINTNFQIVTNNVNALTNSVTSVAGRTGNVVLTINDIVGLNTTYSTQYATQANINAANVGMKGYVDNSISVLVNAAPTTLDTLRELADAIGDDPNFATNIALSVSSANTSMKSYVDGQISAANAGVTSANLGMKGYVDSVASQSIYGNSNVKSYLTGGFDGSILPSANVTYSLGSMTNQWKDLFVSNTTIYLGGTPISVSGGNLLVNGNAVGSYGNAQVNTYLPSYTGNLGAGNVTVSNTGAYKLGSGATKITSSDNTSVELNPDTGANSLAGVKVGGNGYLLGPNGARNITLNYGSSSGAVGLQANVTVGSAGSGNLFVIGNIIARDITAGNVTAGPIVKTGAFSVSSLPSASSVGAGARSFVTDANTITFYSAVTTGGANNVPVFSDGVNWRVG